VLAAEAAPALAELEARLGHRLEIVAEPSRMPESFAIESG